MPVSEISLTMPLPAALVAAANKRQAFLRLHRKRTDWRRSVFAGGATHSTGDERGRSGMGYSPLETGFFRRGRITQG
jgi:hypothetical protein